MIYLELFWEFFKTGLFSIGGGLATIPFLYDIGNRYDWLDTDFIPDMIAISESTPGPIGINMATYTGFNAAGILGAILASLALTLPSVIIIIIVARLLVTFKNDVRVLNGMYGLRPATLGLISAVVFTLLVDSVFLKDLFIESGNFFASFSLKAVLLFIGLFIARLFFKKIHPLFFIILAGILGVVFKF